MLRLPPNATRERGTGGGSLRPNDRRHFQIGPRIRVGGSVGKLGQKVKIGAGKLAENKWVDSALALIPGVGPGVSAAVNAAGHIMDTSNGGIHSVGDVAHDALDAGEAYLGGMGGNAVRDSLGNIASKGIAGAVKSVPGEVLSTAQHIGASGDQSGGLLGTLAADGGKVVNAMGGGSGLVDKALMAGAVAQTAADRARQQQMIDEATKYATGSYNERAPLRAGALAALTDPTSAANKPQDLSSIYGNPGSVYNKIGPRVPVGG